MKLPQKKNLKNKFRKWNNTLQLTFLDDRKHYALFSIALLNYLRTLKSSINCVETIALKLLFGAVKKV